MVSTYLQTNHNLIAQIISEGEARNDEIMSQLFRDFLQQFYQYVPQEDLAEYSACDLFYAAKNAFSFIKERKAGEQKLRIYTPSLDENGFKSPYSIIEMVNDDMPFIVDSTTETINKHGLAIHQIIHPVFVAKRDKTGLLKEVRLAQPGEKDESSESVVQFHVSQTSAPALATKLEEDLKNTLHAVKAAVEDWRLMVDKAQETIKEYQQFGKNLDVYAKGLRGGEFKEELEETIDFMRWIADNNFVLLGYVAYDIDAKTTEALPNANSALGLYKFEEPQIRPRTPQENAALVLSPKLIEITKANKKSIVHRPVHMDFIGLRRFDKKGNVVGEHRFLGLFTSGAYYQSSRNIPIIRKKIREVQNLAGFRHNGHSGKELAAILEALPRDELFQMTSQELYETAMKVVLLEARPNVRLSVRKDSFERFVSCLIYVPRERMSTDLRKKMEDILTSAFKGTVSNHYTQVTDSHLARIQLIIKTEPGSIPSYDVEEIEARLAAVSRLWMDDLADELTRRLGEKASGALLWRYGSAFSASYTESFTAEDAYYDIKQMEKICLTNKTVFDLYESENDAENYFHLKIYNPEKELTLSSIMPVLENMGVVIKDEHTYVAEPQGDENPIWIHHLCFSTGHFEKPRLKHIKPLFEEAIEKVWSGEISNDGFNALIIRAGLHWREVVLIRAYSKYLKQTGFSYGQQFIQETLSQYPQLVKFILELFTIRFDPDYRQDRATNSRAQIDVIEGFMGSVTNLAEDRVLRRFMELVLATIRTNYHQKNSEGIHKPYISFKFNPEKISELPLPKPFAEIFVYSPRVEAVHLRGGKVARGGLRWSDRPEDFRTEVLGLMKAQMTKNAVIVPVGSKGGFVVKKPPLEGGREALQQEAIECYKTFLRGMLDITDNIIDGKTVAPKQVIRHDEDDPYLVVAADKGTATFSDIANSVSAEYQFWLGDAFASGGSVGYDHKKMGITARGAWISVQNHFRFLQKDPMQEDFTAVGVGDMSGDVFGNGLLMSKHFLLVAAFNHQHIFIDPTPNAAESFVERQRLFDLPRSSWTDYNSALISAGGGIYERKAKNITISPEAKKALGIETEISSPDELVQAILRAPVDLLWNGGIGTYVKAETESHEQVGDKANDAVRVNGKELLCKAVGEGGNLGFTQKGRIEYARKGGRINTDAMDNSGGVDCSDHEVNIKIALDRACKQSRLSEADRNQLLEKMTDEVAQLVLRDNHLQTQAITLMEHQAAQLLESQSRLIEDLEKTGLLNRKLEFLPTAEEITRLNAEGKGFTRPELCVLFAYSKIAVYQGLINSDLPEDPYYARDLENYFPEELRRKYSEEIATHPLRREIIVTAVTNSMVNRTGSTFFSRIAEDTGVSASDIARAYTIVREVFHLRDIWLEIEAAREHITVATQNELFLATTRLVESGAQWFLRHGGSVLKVGETIETFTQGIDVLTKNLDAILRGELRQRFDADVSALIQKKVPESLAKRIAALPIISSGCDIVKVSQSKSLPVQITAEVYFHQSERLGLDWMRSLLGRIIPTGHWHRLSIKTIGEILYDQQKRITAETISHFCDGKSCGQAIEKWSAENKKNLERFDSFLSDLKAQETLDTSVMIVAARQLEDL
jgi:glutamate dehydrogenase